MQVVLATLGHRKQDLRDEFSAGLPPPVASAVETLLNDPDRLITTMTVSQPVSSLEEGEAIALAAGRVALEHNLAVKVSLSSSSHVRVRLSRLTVQREAVGGKE